MTSYCAKTPSAADKAMAKVCENCPVCLRTKENIKWLSILLERSEEAIEIVYKIAFEHGPFGKNADIQEKKIIEAKERVGIGIGRMKPRGE